jgi:hypothetical protein
MDIAISIGESVDNPVDGDLDLSAGQPYLVEGAAAVAQSLRIRLRFFLGEWFLNTLEGVPYFRDVLIKNPSIRLLTTLFRNVIRDTPGVDSVRAFELVWDHVDRKLDIKFEALLTGGEVLSADFGEFIVEVV